MPLSNRPRDLADCVQLLVDDEEPNLDLLESFLAPDGYARLVRARNGAEALAFLDSDTPDIVLLDLHMPVQSGFDVLRSMRQRFQPGDFLPVLVLTADASGEARARALSGGAHDYLAKPLDRVEVRLRVRNLLQTRLLHEAQRRAIYLREQILSVVAHDLRNPISSILIDAEMLRHLLDDRGDTTAAHSIRRIERTAGRMHGLIGDLLEVARMQHGTFAVRPEPREPADVFAEAGSLLGPLAGSRDIRLAFEGPTDLPPVRMDGERVVQVLSNLAGNSLRFTPAGGSIVVRWAPRGSELVVSVADTGCGIPEAALPHVFSMFWQAPAQRRQGLGLGLVISRAIVEAHGGRIWIESAEGRGTTVHFSLPFAEPAIEPGAHTQELTS